MNSNNNNQQIDEKQLDIRARRHQYYLSNKEHITERQRRYYIEHASELSIIRRHYRVRKSIESKGTVPCTRRSKYNVHSKVVIEPCKNETYSLSIRTANIELINQPSVQQSMNVNNCVQQNNGETYELIYVNALYHNEIQQQNVQPGNGETNML